MSRGMDTFVMLALVAAGCMVLFYFALPMLHFANIAAINSTDAGSQARVLATNQTDYVTFLVGLGGNGILWYVLVLIVVAAFMILYYSGRRR